jgi:hypothetical protein
MSPQKVADIYLRSVSGVEATCSARRSSSGWHNPSTLANLHELRQSFSPYRPEGAFNRLMEGLESWKK